MKTIDERIDAAINLERLTRKARYIFLEDKDEIPISNKLIMRISDAMRVIIGHLSKEDIKAVTEPWKKW